MIHRSKNKIELLKCPLGEAEWHRKSKELSEKIKRGFTEAEMAEHMEKVIELSNVLIRISNESAPNVSSARMKNIGPSDSNEENSSPMIEINSIDKK